jgi:hypothetical protein
LAGAGATSVRLTTQVEPEGPDREHASDSLRGNSSREGLRPEGGPQCRLILGEIGRYAGSTSISILTQCS